MTFSAVQKQKRRYWLTTHSKNIHLVDFGKACKTFAILQKRESVKMSFDDPHGGSSSDEYDEKWDRPWKTNNNDKTPPAKTVDRVCMSVSSAFG